MATEPTNEHVLDILRLALHAVVDHRLPEFSRKSQKLADELELALTEPGIAQAVANKLIDQIMWNRDEDEQP